MLCCVMLRYFECLSCHVPSGWKPQPNIFHRGKVNRSTSPPPPVMDELPQHVTTLYTGCENTLFHSVSNENEGLFSLFNVVHGRVATLRNADHQVSNSV